MIERYIRPRGFPVLSEQMSQTRAQEVSEESWAEVNVRIRPQSGQRGEFDSLFDRLAFADKSGGGFLFFFLEQSIFNRIPLYIFTEINLAMYATLR